MMQFSIQYLQFSQQQIINRIHLTKDYLHQQLHQNQQLDSIIKKQVN
jgi:hypothetical protein